MGKQFKAGLGLLFIALSAVAGAQPAILINDGTVGLGGTVPINIDLDADGTITQLNFSFTYDPTVFTADITNCGAGNSTITPGQTSCSNPNPGEINVVHGQLGTDPLTDGTFGTVAFTADANAAPGPYDLTLTVQSFSNAGGDAVEPVGSSNGVITVECPTGESCYASNPEIGDLIAFGTAVVGQQTAVETIGVRNLQDDTTTSFQIGGTSSTGTNVSTSATVTGGFPAIVPADGGGTVVALDFTCTPQARGTVTGTITVANDANNPAGAEEYPFSCAGLAPNVDVSPNAASTTALAVSGGDTSVETYTITNDNSDGFSSSADNVTIAANLVSGPGGTDPVVTTGTVASVAAGASVDFDVSCAADENTTVGTYDYDVTVTWDDPSATGGTSSETVEFICEVVDTAPIYEANPAPDADGVSDATAEISLTSQFGTQSAVSGIDVINGNPNTTTPADDLVINSVVLSDTSVFSADLINSVFPPGGSFDGDNDIEVTCTPPGVGTVTGTLTVDTNDPTQPTGGFIYDLSCEGTGDVLSSSPPAGGTLNLGTVPPNSQTGEGFIRFTNNGIAGSGTVDVSCTVTDASGVFTFNPDPIQFTVAEGDTASAGFQCTPTEVANFTAGVSCSYSGATTGSADFTVACSGRPLVIPTMSRWGLVLMSFMLLLVAGFAGRRMLA